MRREGPRPAPLVGVALGGALAAVIAAALLTSSPTGAPPQRGYLVLPRAPASGTVAAPAVVATPMAKASAPRASDRGIWATPAEFAPPE